MIKEMQEQLEKSFGKGLSQDVISSYYLTISNARINDARTTLVNAGRFVETIIIALQFIETGKAETEVKSVHTAIEVLKKSAKLEERTKTLLLPIIYSSIYSVRNKRDAIHVKSSQIIIFDIELLICACNWALCEIVSCFCEIEDSKLEQWINSILARRLPLIETIDGEEIVIHPVKSSDEILLLIANAENGISRKELGKVAKCSPSSITTRLIQLEKGRLVHKTQSGSFRVTRSGMRYLEENVFPK